MSPRTIERADSRATKSTQVAPSVRTLLARTGHFTVSTPLLAAYIGNVIVREQFDHFIDETVKWSLAMFDVTCMSGGAASRSIAEIGLDVDEYIENRIETTTDIELKLAITAVLHSLETVYGKQLHLTGWLPGYRVAEGRTVLELSGDACPNCLVNPTGYKVNNKSTTRHCLNSEDCGWMSA
ncbi:hypothetical protein [Cryobacterium zhongshanensis]|uniref:Uncharacterized protein n=1 Tax=Cryobacterium zhongshanensis TaxID=2928153 RepID=A0AA41QXY4_9MICO|nr:hypothetical protein [Cryobacterium zhongshanensis]MCI4659756.1 hypothetical protein [Cryobacterium zhongshanensis]